MTHYLVSPAAKIFANLASDKAISMENGEVTLAHYLVSRAAENFANLASDNAISMKRMVKLHLFLHSYAAARRRAALVGLRPRAAPRAAGPFFHRPGGGPSGRRRQGYAWRPAARAAHGSVAKSRAVEPRGCGADARGGGQGGGTHLAGHGKRPCTC